MKTIVLFFAIILLNFANAECCICPGPFPHLMDSSDEDKSSENLKYDFTLFTLSGAAGMVYTLELDSGNLAIDSAIYSNMYKQRNNEKDTLDANSSFDLFMDRIKLYNGPRIFKAVVLEPFKEFFTGDIIYIFSDQSNCNFHFENKKFYDIYIHQTQYENRLAYSFSYENNGNKTINKLYNISKCWVRETDIN